LRITAFYVISPIAVSAVRPANIGPTVVKPMARNRRKLERFELSTPALMMIASDAGTRREFDLTTKNLSSDGAFLYTSQPFSEGADVNLEFFITQEMIRSLRGEKGRAKVRVKGKVVRIEDDGVAVQFTSKYKITAAENGRRAFPLS